MEPLELPKETLQQTDDNQPLSEESAVTQVKLQDFIFSSHFNTSKEIQNVKVCTMFLATQ